MAVKIKNKEITCNTCGQSKVVNTYNFFKSYSPLHKSKVSSICKPYVYEIYNRYLTDGMDSRTATIELCRILDKPFIQEAFDRAIENCKDNKKFLGNYFRIAHLQQYLKQGINSFKDSYLVEDNFKVENKKEDKSGTNSNLIDFWGKGYEKDPEFYELFEKKYKELTRGYDLKTPLHIEALKTYIRFRVKEEVSTAKGDDAGSKRWGELAQKASQDGKLNVSQLNKSDLLGGIDLISQIFAAVETEAGIIPILPKVMEQPYDDVDMIIWCIINYYRRLDDKPPIKYREIWNFYDDMINNYCRQNRMSDKETDEYKRKRNNVFKDLEEIFVEPSYSEDE